MDKPPTRKIPRKLQVEVFRRDYWLCRWCKRPVFFAPAMKYLQLDLNDAGFNGLAYWRFAWDRRGAPVLDELAAVVDHVKAFSVGGSGDADNLVTSCNRCNIRKNNTDAKQWERDHPFKPIKAKYGEPVNWDGFASVFVRLASRYSATLTKTEQEWLRLFETGGQAASPISNR